MTPAQFDALAALIHLRQSASRDAARLVLVDGLSVLDAASRCGISVQGANQAVLRCRRALDLARVAVTVPAGTHPLQPNTGAGRFSEKVPTSRAASRARAGSNQKIVILVVFSRARLHARQQAGGGLAVAGAGHGLRGLVLFLG